MEQTALPIQRFRNLCVVCGVVLAILASPAGAADQMQRMLIPTGCYRLAGHATSALPAYCLDQTGAAPRFGAILSETPALGQATVSIGGQTMSLKAALKRRVVRIEGSGTHDQLALVNLTGQPISLCVGQPVIVMGNGMTYSEDLKPIYSQLVDATKSDAAPKPVSHQTDPDDAQARVQQQLWQLVIREEQQESLAPWPQPGTAESDRENCLAKANVTETTFIICR